MFSSLHCVALRTIKYDDSRSIVTAWSAEAGRVSLLVPAGGSREARRRRALMMPMGLFEGEADLRPGRDLVSMRDVRPSAVLADMACHPLKASVAMFLAEILEKILRESPPDRALYDFIAGAVIGLDATASARAVANYPLLFLLKLNGLLGIEPDTGTWAPGAVFDMEGGLWRRSAPMAGRWLRPDEARLARFLCRLSLRRAGAIGLPRDIRRQALDIAIEYLSIHYTPINNLTTLSILQSLY